MGKKLEIRTQMRRIITCLDHRWVRSASSLICQHLNTLLEDQLQGKVKHILAWTAFFPGEVDLSKFIDLQVAKSQVYLPRIDANDAMEFIALQQGVHDWREQLHPGKFGISEPKPKSGLTYDNAWAEETLIIIPGMAFDLQGGRLGRGRGYYDRFLASQSLLKAQKLGVCLSLQLVDKVPVEAHDVAMDWVLHERELFKIQF